MSLELWLSNLWFYSLQTGILILVGGLLAWISRLRAPGRLYLYWRLLLAGCLILVFQPGVPGALPDPVSVPSLGVSVLTTAQAANPEARPVANLYPWLGGLLVSGIVLRLIWLGIGLFRLRRLKLSTVRLPLPRQVQMLKEKLGVSARFRVSSEVSGPITFGCLQPVVIFPESFTELDEGMQSAVACHELLHVKRRDWLWNTLDEVVKTLFWFHPGFHWLVGRIQLTREQTVDEQAVILLGSRKTYLQSLVEIAKRRTSTPLPAPLFLKESQLRRRVQLLLQLREVRMSTTKTSISLAVSLVVVAVTGWWSVAALPLKAPPSARLPQAEFELQAPINVGSNVMKKKLVHRVAPEYPVHLTTAQPVGLVILAAVIGKKGEVQQVEVVRGDKRDPALNSAAMDAVRQWRYEPYLLNGQRIRVRTTVFVRFPPEGIDPQMVDLGLDDPLVDATLSLQDRLFIAMKETRRKIERVRNDTERIVSEMAGIDPQMVDEMKEARRQFERVRNDTERVVSEMARIDLQVVDEMKEAQHQLERVRKELERLNNEIKRLLLEYHETGGATSP